MDASFTAMHKPWLSDQNIEYDKHLPGFYDVADFPWVPYVESHWETIRDELLAVLDAQKQWMNPYPDLSKTDKAATWHTAGLIYWTEKYPEIIKLFPKTWSILREIPNVTSCSFNKLAAHSTIKPHIGDTDAMYRHHLGLIVPAQLPKVGFRVGNETRCWQNGKIFAFNDAYEHTAWNNSDEDRYIMSFDVMRAEYVSSRFWTSAQILGKIYVEVVYQHKLWLAKYFGAPWIKRTMAGACKMAAWVKIHRRAFALRHL